MAKRAFQWLLIACLGTSPAYAANDPFVGEWKLNPSRSKLADEMKVESVGGNRYAFDFGGGKETVVVDGTDQPAGFGTTLSVAAQGPHSWKVVRKQNGHVLLIGIWTLSNDGRILKDQFTSVQANGSRSTVDYVYKQTATVSGFAGDWISTSETLAPPAYVLRIQPYKNDGLSYVIPSAKQTTILTFDGKDYPRVGPNAAAGSAYAARRPDKNTLDITDKINGKVVQTRRITLSDDFKTLTMTLHAVDRTVPDVLVFDRQ